MRSLLRRCAAVATIATATLALPALGADPFPSRTVRIVPFGSGGGPIGGISRMYAEKLQQRWGQPVIVEAKPGASGIIAADFVARAPGDGYTVFLTLSLTHVNNAALNRKLPYDPVKDFEPLGELAIGSPMLVVRADAPYSDLKGLVEWAAARPDTSYGSWGNGSQPHLFGELFKRQNHLRLIHVPYNSEGTMHTDLLGGSLDLAWANPATARGHVQGGKMKVLAVAGTTRLAALPGVPTFAEQGFKGFDIDSWLGVFAPAKTPPEVIEKWVQALREITALADVRERLVGYGFEPLGAGPAELAANMRRDRPLIAELIKAAGVTPE